jgi:hypothetical protein
MDANKTDYSDKTFLMFDNGQFLNVALALAKTVKNVIFYNRWANGFPQPDDVFLGSGYKEFEKSLDFWTKVDEADVIIFCDVCNKDEVEFLRSKGYPVWGAGAAEDLELDRVKAKQILKKVGLPVNLYTPIDGFENLKKFLKGKKDLYIKVNGNIRGLIETMHYDDDTLAEPIFNDIQSKIVGYEDLVQFIVETPIKSKVEPGTDTICVDGQYPKKLINGYENKDLDYIAQVIEWDAYPKMMRNTLEKLSPVFKQLEYRGFFSTEEKITEDKKSYLIDCTCRMGFPSGSTQLALIDNLSEIIYWGARGELREPIFKAKFAAEAMIVCPYAQYNPNAIHFPDKIKEMVNIGYSIKRNGVVYTVPKDMSSIGSVTSIGNSIDECRDKLDKVRKDINGYCVSIDMRSLDETIEMMKEGNKILGL